MNEGLCGPALEQAVEDRLDALLEFCGNLESDLKDVRRRIANLEVALLAMQIDRL